MASGRQTRFQICFQNDWEPLTTPVPTLALEEKTNSLTGQQTMIESEANVGARFTHGVTPNNEKAEGDFAIEGNPINMGPLVYWALGNEEDVTEIVENEVYEHTITPVSGDQSLPMIFGLLDKQIDVFGYESLKCDSMSLSQTPDAYLEASFTARGRREIIKDHSEADLSMENLSYTNVRPFIFQDLAIKFGTAGGTANTVMVDASDFNMEYSNGLEDDKQRANGSPYMSEVDFQAGELTIDIEADYTTRTNVLRENNKRAGVPVSLEISFTTNVEIAAGHYYTMTISVPNMYITEHDPSIDGADNITNTISFKAVDNGVDTPVTITIKDGIDGKYSNVY